MAIYLARRLLHSVLTLLGVSVAVFLLLWVLPGDPASMLLPEGSPPEVVEQLSRAMGLREPLHVQYLIFLRNVLGGELGESFQYKAPALQVVVERFPATIQLSAAALALALFIGIPAGIVAAIRHGSRADYLAMFLAALGQALPNFWLGIMLILVFGVGLGWLPTSGSEGPRYIILPAVTLGAYPIALFARLTRSNLLEVLGTDYIRTAWGKGLRERNIVLSHALKNAAIPVVTVVGMQFGYLLGGAVITETIFAWPGIGRLVVQAIFWRDYPIVQAVLILSAGLFIAINVLVDLLYLFLDPRIKYE
ncbi:MAG: ABC transporter permease [Chloroflexota bacterium]